MEEFKIEDEDLYEILEIVPASSIKEIKKAYRKKALQCHPDKNPDNPNAAKLFHNLTRILEVLTDAPARAAYDRVLKGKKEAAIRHKELDSKRRKFKEDLEARENAAKRGSQATTDAVKLLNEEVQRLRKEGAQLVRDEINNLKKKLEEDLCNISDCRVKISWKAVKGDLTNGGYNEELLRKLLSQYGSVSALIISSKKTGSALVEFETQDAARMAIELEHGLSDNPLQLAWLYPRSKHTAHTANNDISGSTIKPSDYESIVITKLKQAEERKRLIEQMKAEDDSQDE